MNIKERKYPDHKGKNNPMWGVTRTDDEKQRISEKQKNRYEVLQEILHKQLTKEDIELIAERIAEAVTNAFRDNGLFVCKEVEDGDQEKVGEEVQDEKEKE